MTYLLNWISCVALLALIEAPLRAKCSSQGEHVESWAKKFGKELYDLGQVITKSFEIKSRYSFLNAQVTKKDPEKLLSEIVEGVSQMMDRKMDAINCILQVAETKAEQIVYNENDTMQPYYSSKYSPIEGAQAPELPESMTENVEKYLNMSLNEDTHFYNIAVNTSFSSVHVPTNIFDRHEEAHVAIQWSEALDEVFKQNYNSDPALSWQYFGSSSGIMRHYPAMKWKQLKKDLFDCRIRPWYIEAATCTKDAVILIDNSGSMQGFNKHIASLTVYSILETFSNNDYINVMNYSTHANYTVPCFADILVQATPDNIEIFKEAVQRLDPHDKTNVESALVDSFKLLKKYREKRGCNENSTDCNQVIMLITDGISKNLSEVLLKYNYLYNGSNIPVRLFTYLIGPEVSNLNEIVWMACNSRGYFSNVASLEQVTGAVLEYINVIARPLVLQGVEHPVSWTHAYADLTHSENIDEISDPYKYLITSVAIPAFDRKINQNNESREARLLGVAATDVPIDDIQRLTFPYKIGVNAHAFIVSNNGYVIMHPGLRPIFKKKFKPNFNSIDLTEVQQLDDDSEPRELGDTLLDLRMALVNGEENVRRDVPLKYHYNNMRRVSRELFDFYYARLPDTPFSIALAFPNKFGYYAVQVPDEINRNRHTGSKLTNFFKGTNWKIHPKWTYCRYHYLEGHEFDTPENELLHFLKQMYDNDFKWTQQYEGNNSERSTIECGRKTLGDDDYYCDKELIQMLIFDAKSTNFAFDEPWTFKNDREERLFERYNATLRFVATMSGLTRWEYIFGEENNHNNTMEFGDFHSRAIDETWYKSAVLQHQYDTESFVYSVPFEASNKDDMLVTGSYAIFPKDAGKESPASVVGFQFSHSHMSRSFFNIASNTKFCDECIPCGPLLDCYVIDSSGYIIISPDANQTGLFFGEVQGAVLDEMLNAEIFKKLRLYDYQAVCSSDPYYATESTAITPYSYVTWIIKSFLTKIFWMLFEINEMWTSRLVSASSIEDPDQKYFYTTVTSNDSIPNNRSSVDDEIDVEDEVEETDDDDDEEEEEPHYYTCDQQKDLYILNQALFIDGNGFPGEVPRNCSRPFFAKRIPHSNLLLVAINATYGECTKTFDTIPRRIVYPNVPHHPCQKLYLNHLPRRRLQGCFNEHPLEHEIKSCGRSGSGGAKSRTSSVYLVGLLLVIEVV